MIILSKDVTNSAIKPFAVADHQITNANGSVSFVNADGTIVGQEPGQEGVRHDVPSIDGVPNIAGIGVYQMFMVAGALVTIQTRPQDPMFVYTIAQGQAF